MELIKLTGQKECALVFRVRRNGQRPELMRNFDASGKKGAVAVTDYLFLGSGPNAHTNLNGPTSDGRRGTVFPSIAAGRLGTRLRYRRCSSGVCMSTPKHPFCAATSHRAGIGCAGRTARRLSCLRPPGRERWSLSSPGPCACCLLCAGRGKGSKTGHGPWANRPECSSDQIVAPAFQSPAVPRSCIFLTSLVRKCLHQLLLSRNLCYKPEHA